MPFNVDHVNICRCPIRPCCPPARSPTGSASSGRPSTRTSAAACSSAIPPARTGDRCSSARRCKQLAARARSGDRSDALEVVVETQVTLLDPDGRLFYRGQDATELARFSTFERVAGLLWGGPAGAPWELDAASAAIVGPAGRGAARGRPGGRPDPSRDRGAGGGRSGALRSPAGGGAAHRRPDPGRRARRTAGRCAVKRPQRGRAAVGGAEPGGAGAAPRAAGGAGRLPDPARRPRAGRVDARSPGGGVGLGRPLSRRTGRTGTAGGRAARRLPARRRVDVGSDRRARGGLRHGGAGGRGRAARRPGSATASTAIAILARTTCSRASDRPRPTPVRLRPSRLSSRPPLRSACRRPTSTWPSPGWPTRWGWRPGRRRRSSRSPGWRACWRTRSRSIRTAYGSDRGPPTTDRPRGADGEPVALTPNQSRSRTSREVRHGTMS